VLLADAPTWTGSCAACRGAGLLRPRGERELGLRGDGLRRHKDRASRRRGPCACPAKARRRNIRRRCAASPLVEVDGWVVELNFITNNFAWSPRTVAEFLPRPGAIETFFKVLMKTLQLADFVATTRRRSSGRLDRAAGHMMRASSSTSRSGASASPVSVHRQVGGLDEDRPAEALSFFGRGRPQPARNRRGTPVFQGFERFSMCLWDSNPRKCPISGLPPYPRQTHFRTAFETRKSQ
jgi:hypothetical protein